MSKQNKIIIDFKQENPREITSKVEPFNRINDDYKQLIFKALTGQETLESKKMFGHN